MTTYGLPNAWELSLQRFELLAECHDADSIARARQLGVGPGWRCLEAGAGAGSFARWLAETTGDVLAVDLDTHLIEEAPGLHVQQLDLVTGELPQQAFDLVHTRLVLIHIPERDAVLEQLVAALKPGGILFVEEDDTFPIDFSYDPTYRAAWARFLELMTATDGAWARTLPTRLTQLGLTDIDATMDVQFFPGGSAPARFWSLTWQQKGESEHALLRGRLALEDPARWFHGPAKVAAWGRKPTPP